METIKNTFNTMDDNSLLLLTTPSYIFDETEFERGITLFHDALNSRFNKVLIGYSVKTNSLPYTLKQARTFGCMAEVVSHDEYQLARLCGFTPSEIIYNGPMKSKETFLDALTGGAIVNIETKRELTWLLDLPTNNIYKVGLRLNINISKVSPEDADGDDDNSRFGFAVESNEFAEAVSFINSLAHIEINGLHIHRTAHSRAPRFYERSIRYATSVIKNYHLHLDYLDVGGGYFGILPNTPTFFDYAESFYMPLSEAGLDDLKIIVEPGNALTASSFSFLTEVIDVKRVDDKTIFVTTDGSRNDVDPFYHKSDYIKELFYLEDDERNTVKEQIITGCTCLEYDRLFTLQNAKRLRPGDRILYKNVGAYTLTLSPQFIRLWPRVYAVNGKGNYKQVRRQSVAQDLMINNEN